MNPFQIVNPKIFNPFQSSTLSNHQPFPIINPFQSSTLSNNQFLTLSTFSNNQPFSNIYQPITKHLHIIPRQASVKGLPLHLSTVSSQASVLRWKVSPYQKVPYRHVQSAVQFHTFVVEGNILCMEFWAGYWLMFKWLMFDYSINSGDESAPWTLTFNVFALQEMYVVSWVISLPSPLSWWEQSIISWRYISL